MTDSSSSRNGSHDSNGARSKAAAFFKEKTNRKVAIYQQMETEQLLIDNKIAKLRALRLAKEKAECESASPTEPHKPT